MFKSWLQCHSSWRPRLESLERRVLPSVLTVSDIADSGIGSLRAAIALANNGDTIIFALPTPSTINVTSGPLDVEKSIDIAGPGASFLTLQSNGTSRVFQIGATNSLAKVTMSGLTITGGQAIQGAGVNNAATLTLIGDIITANNNMAAANTGGAGVFNSGTMELENTVVSSNTSTATNGGEALGAGIENSGTATLLNSTVENNITNALSSGADGGGIESDGTLSLINSFVFNNLAEAGSSDVAFGGGIFNFGRLAMVGTTLASNSAVKGLGGGLAAEDGTVTLTDCTVADHNVARVGGGIAIVSFISTATLTLNNCTIGGNSTPSGGSGGGLFISSTGSQTVTIENTIVGANIAPTDPDISGNPTTALFNLISNGSGTNITNGSNGNIVGVEPLLGPFQNNGGPTETVALLPGSPAIDAGSNGLVTTATDQRGLPRIVGKSVDMGASESQARPILVTAGGHGQAPEVKVFEASTGALLLDFDAYDPHFLGGVRVAVGDVNGDGIPDIITAPGPGGGPDIRVFNGGSGAKTEEFFAYDPRFQAGVFLAAGDVNGDGLADIITGPDEFSGPDVRVFFAGNISGKPD